MSHDSNKPGLPPGQASNDAEVSEHPETLPHEAHPTISPEDVSTESDSTQDGDIIDVENNEEVSENPQTLPQKTNRMICAEDVATESDSTQDGDTHNADENPIGDGNRRRRKRRMKLGAIVYCFVLLCLVILVTNGFTGTGHEEHSMFDNNLGALNSTPTVSPTGSQAEVPIGGSPTDTKPSTRTMHPTISAMTPGSTTTPSNQPSTMPTKVATPSPTFGPTSNPTNGPTSGPTPGPTIELLGNSYIIGDLPYTEEEKDRLILHVNSLPDDAEFLVHIGDIRNAEDKSDCKMSEFKMVADILKQSPVPVFIVPGGKQHDQQTLLPSAFVLALTSLFFSLILVALDNEYNDCPNLDESWGDWLSEFADFEKHWDSSLKVNRAPGRPESFYFVHKRMLYIGLNIVGGERSDNAEWESRLSEQWTWTKSLIETHVLSEPSDASGIVIFGHAYPRPHDHATFFEPLRNYIAKELDNEIPILYVNGDQHYYQFDDDFYGQSNFQRIMVEGGSSEPPLKLSVNVPSTSNHDKLNAADVFAHDRHPL
eukprot:scaffold1599_cov115-Cylindrotheca_fusiformis.AAC.4